MSIELWSRKQGLVRPPETLLYAKINRNDFPGTFRHRVYMWTDTAFERIEFGTNFGEVINLVADSWQALYEGLCSAYGRRPLVTAQQMRRSRSSVPAQDMEGRGQLGWHLPHCPDNEVMDFISGVFQISATQVEACGSRALADEAAEIGTLINRIFYEEGIGYRWVAGQIVRFDEPVTHELAVEPAIKLLNQGQFGEANREFSTALDAYRDSRWRDAITNANAAFESVLKIQTGKANLTAGSLIAEARKQGLIPKYLGNAIDHLEKLLHASPATRGAVAAHGQGEKPSDADQHLAQFIVSVVAASILFLGRPTT